MATVAVGARDVATARSTTDRVLLREYLERDRLFAAYAICDLAEREFPRTRWGVARSGDEVVSVGMEYSGMTPQPVFVMGDADGVAAILRDVVRPRVAYIAAKAELLPAVARHYRVDPGPEMIRMWLDRGMFEPVTARVERLLPVDVHDLNRLYQLGFAAWLPSSAVAEGVYYGIRVNGKLVAAAGTHVVSREARLAVVGNVLTHVDHRGRGYAKAVTSAVTAELLRTCDQVVLNVRADNPPAIAAYRHLGYEDHCRFEERLIRRTSPSWPDLAGPIRRFFSGRRSPAAPPTIDQAHPMRPTVGVMPSEGVAIPDGRVSAPAAPIAEPAPPDTPATAAGADVGAPPDVPAPAVPSNVTPDPSPSSTEAGTTPEEPT
jgi:GNAT superfamily N-acetyltransferase